MQGLKELIKHFVDTHWEQVADLHDDVGVFEELHTKYERMQVCRSHENQVKYKDSSLMLTSFTTLCCVALRLVSFAFDIA